MFSVLEKNKFFSLIFSFSLFLFTINKLYSSLIQYNFFMYYSLHYYVIHVYVTNFFFYFNEVLNKYIYIQGILVFRAARLPILAKKD